MSANGNSIKNTKFDAVDGAEDDHDNHIDDDDGDDDYDPDEDDEGCNSPKKRKKNVSRASTHTVRNVKKPRMEDVGGNRKTSLLEDGEIEEEKEDADDEVQRKDIVTFAEEGGTTSLLHAGLGDRSNDEDNVNHGGVSSTSPSSTRNGSSTSSRQNYASFDSSLSIRTSSILASSVPTNYPTLCELCSLMYTCCNGSNRERTLSVFSSMVKWSEGPQKQGCRFKKNFIRLSGPLHLLFYIDKHKKDAQLARMAARLCVNCFVVAEEGLEELFDSTREILVEANCVTIFAGVLKELSNPQSNDELCAVDAIWMIILFIVHDWMPKEREKMSILQCMHQLKLEKSPTPLASHMAIYRILVSFAGVLFLIIRASEAGDATLKLLNETKTVRCLRKNFEKFNKHETYYVLNLVEMALVKDVISEEEFLKWLPIFIPVITFKLSMSPNKAILELNVIFNILENVDDRRKLVSKDMGELNYALMRSNNAPSSIKDRCGKLMIEILMAGSSKASDEENEEMNELVI